VEDVKRPCSLKTGKAAWVVPRPAVSSRMRVLRIRMAHVLVSSRSFKPLLDFVFRAVSRGTAVCIIVQPRLAAMESVASASRSLR
jgi:hypothetical protein